MKKILSLVLALCLAAALVPVSLAEDATPVTGGTLKLGIHITPDSMCGMYGDSQPVSSCREYSNKGED